MTGILSMGGYMFTIRRLLGLVFVVLAAVSCGRNTDENKPDKNTPKAGDSAKEESDIVIPVEATLPTRGDISSYFETTTRVVAENRVQVTAEAVGECLKVCVEEGDLVSSGTVLAELDPKETLAALGQAEVQVRQTKAALDVAENSLAMGIGPKVERDNAKFAHEQAIAAHAAQKVRLDKLTIKAPIGGVVTTRNIQVGQLVSAGMPIFNLVDPASFILTINPPEKELSRLRVGQVAKVTIDALGTKEFEARVRRINPGVDAVSGTVKVTLDFDRATREQLREAAFARVRLVMETHENALLVAKDALVEENARKYLFVVEEAKKETSGKDKTPADALEAPGKDSTAQTATSEKTEEPDAPPETEQDAQDGDQSKPKWVANRIEVETGLEDSNNIEVLSGITDTSLVVTMGQHTLKSGSFVSVTNTQAEIGAKAGISADDALKAAQERRADETKKKEAAAQEARKKRARKG